MKKIHQQTFKEVLKQLNSDEKKGLSSIDAKKRLDEYGPNTLVEKKKKTLFIRFLSQFKDFLVIILLIASIISVAINPKEWIESLIILIVVLVNAVLGVIQESKAEHSLEALKKMSTPNAKVIRDNEVISLSTINIVKGDIIVLEAGDYIPADARIIEAVNLQVDESALTGESVPVLKTSEPLEKEQMPLGDCINLLYSSTYVTYGRGKAIVVATGMQTEIGKIAQALLQDEGDITPLQIRLEQIGKVIAIICLFICALVLGLELLSKTSFTDAFMTAVALAVAAIPEALATVVTVVLAIGVEKMAKRNAIVKKLPAVETLGCASIVCSDKTGTLTQNKMTVVALFYNQKIKETKGSLTPEEQQLLIYFALCTDAKISKIDGVEKRIGDPTELALLDIVNKYQIKSKYEGKRVADLPFDSTRKMMSVIFRDGDGFLVITKGAPDIILEHSTLEDKNAPTLANHEMASLALRVLGLGIKRLRQLPQNLTSKEIEHHLEFVGLVGMIDPARPEVKDAIQVALKAGIRTIMITGDHIDTAIAIAKDLKIMNEGDLALAGVELHYLSDQKLYDDIEKYTVYARVAPEDKVRIVEAWQKKGHVVAMTGDGVNDSPALKRADIGCAMGISGTDVAKEASDVILVDDNYQTIITAVSLGRNIYANIKKVVKYLLSSNIGEVFTIFVASLISAFTKFKLGIPLYAIHLLWVNLITDSLPAFALGTEEVDDDIMDLPPRPKKESFFAHKMGSSIIWQGIMIGSLTLTAYIIGHYASPTTYLGQTMAFMTLSTTQLFHAFNMKSDHSIFNKHLFNNLYLIGAFFIGIILLLVLIYVPPIASVFKVVRLPVGYLLICFVLSMMPIFIIELVKKLKYQ